MEYRFLGRTGLQVSCIGFGNMINYSKEDEGTNVAIVKRALELGVNFFDTAENYGAGQAEEALGRAFQLLKVPRETIVISTKIINRGGEGNSINRTWTLSRKHIIEGTNESLKRLQMEYVDLIFAHIYDYNTTIEEVCRGFNQVIEDGKAFYWATSNWNASQIQEAINVCDRLGLHRPVAEQSQYNMLERNAIEVDLAPIFNNAGYGTTIWSPLAMGILTGKYNDQIPEISRSAEGLPFFPKDLLNGLFFDKHLNNKETVKKLQALGELSKELGCSQAQLSVAWTLRSKDVSTSIIGARSVAQLENTLEALEVLKKFTPELDERIESILNNRPPASLDYRKWTPLPNRR